MRKASCGITPEGAPAIGLSALASLVFALLSFTIPALLFFCLTVFSTWFFRDPERVTPTEPGLAVSPADGVVVKSTRMRDPFTGEYMHCICVFMNIFNVHVNRFPVAGTVAAITYHPGRFFNASLDKASEHNERCSYALLDQDGERWSMVQIAGLIARRIVCRVDEGDALDRGARFGMIRFGSRVDLYLPDSYLPKIRIGQKVVAGETVLAVKA